MVPSILDMRGPTVKITSLGDIPTTLHLRGTYGACMYMVKYLPCLYLTELTPSIGTCTSNHCYSYMYLYMHSDDDIMGLIFPVICLFDHLES